jgi:flagellar biosynthesis protein FlhG
LARTRPDQAEGLRRLLDGAGLRVLSVSSGDGGGSAATIVNLAGAFAECGRDVLIFDEHSGARGVTAALGLTARFDLEDVIMRRRDLEEVIVRGPAGILVLPLARGALSLSRLPAPEQQRLVDRCGRLDFPVDTLLVDAAPGSGSAVFWPGAAAQQVIALAGGGAAAITKAYALIKRLTNEFARREFHVLVSNVASEGEARAIFANMAGAARRYLQVTLNFLGYVPPDDKLQHAARLHLPVVAAFPETAAAASFRNLAQAVAGWPRAEADDNGFDDFMRRFIHSNLARAAAA